MDRIVCYIPSFNDSVQAADSLASSPDWEVVVSDNCSEPEHGRALAQMVEQAGAKALTVNCRTRTQGYQGKADWTWLAKIKKAIRIPLIGNGDAATPEDIKRMLDTGCDGVMIGRGAIANPWIFRQAKHYLTTGQLPPEPSPRERIEVCLEHLQLAVQQRGLPWGVINFRKYYAGYLRGLPDAARVRAELMTLTSPDQIAEHLWRYIEEHSALPTVV